MKISDERTTTSSLFLGSPRRNLNLLCFPKLKFPIWSQSQSLPPPPPPAAAGTPTTTLIKTFNSLYDSPSNSTSITPYSSSSSSSSSTLSSYPDPDPAAAPEPDLSAVYASHRFFFSSPGRSNSIIESLTYPEPTARMEQDGSRGPVVDGGVAVPTYSPDPFADFRRSMQEMVDARQLFDVKSNWDCLHELLLCYLSLNPKSTHKFIVGAFADLLVSLMCNGGGDCQSHRRRQTSSGHATSSCDRPTNRAVQ